MHNTHGVRLEPHLLDVESAKIPLLRKRAVHRECISSCSKYKQPGDNLGINPQDTKTQNAN